MGLRKDGGRDGSAWWRELIRIWDGVGMDMGISLRIIFGGRLGTGLILFSGVILGLGRFL